MRCSACSNGLEKYLNKQDGIISASVNLVMANASIEYDEKKLNQSKIEEFVKKAGFKSLGEFKKYIDSMKSRSIYNFNENISEDDSILTLSTCANNKYRVILHAKKVKD